MSTSQLIAMVLVAVIGVLGGAAAAATVNAWARRKVTEAEADNMVVESADLLLARQQVQLDRSDMERGRLQDEIKELRDSLDEVRAKLISLERKETEYLKMAAMFRHIEDAMPMGEFADVWLTEFNVTVAHPRGLHVWIYTDDVREEIALAHGVVALEDVPVNKRYTEVQVRSNKRNLDAYAQEKRTELGHPPIPPTPGESI